VLFCIITNVIAVLWEKCIVMATHLKFQIYIFSPLAQGHKEFKHPDGYKFVLSIKITKYNFNNSMFMLGP
jgi:hypothetical protein